MLRAHVSGTLHLLGSLIAVSPALGRALTYISHVIGLMSLRGDESPVGETFVLGPPLCVYSNDSVAEELHGCISAIFMRQRGGGDSLAVAESC